MARRASWVIGLGLVAGLVPRLASAACTAQVVNNQFVVSGCDLVVTGGNVIVINGAGSTATANGKGNVIVGYNEQRGSGNEPHGEWQPDAFGLSLAQPGQVGNQDRQ